MYVCICNSISHREIEDAVKRGDVLSPACLRKRLGVGTECGLCLEFAEEFLSRALAQNLPCNAMAQQYESSTKISITATVLNRELPAACRHVEIT